VDGLVLLLKGIDGRFRSIEVEVMLSPTEIATIWAELKRLEKARKDCTDSGLRKWIDAEIREAETAVGIRQYSRVADSNRNPARGFTPPRSLSRAVAWNRGAFLQRRPNLAALLSAQRREPESVLCSQCTNNFCRDHLFVAVGQRDFERYGFAQCESFGNERPHTTFAEITRPPLEANLLAVPLETNPNPRLEHVPG
jgi:hypothetical protein